jgi:hypothetical protein
MSSLTQETVLDRLKSVKYPGFSRDIVSFGLVKAVSVDGTRRGISPASYTANRMLDEPPLIDRTQGGTDFIG